MRYDSEACSFPNQGFKNKKCTNLPSTKTYSLFSKISCLSFFLLNCPLSISNEIISTIFCFSNTIILSHLWSFFMVIKNDW